MLDQWREEMERRARRRHAMTEGKSQKSMEGLRGLDREACRRSFLEFCRNYGWLYAPGVDEAPRRIVPFLPWPSQVELIEWLEGLEGIESGASAFVRKSREIGVSWTILTWIAWRFIFEQGFKARVGSRKEHYVDKLGDLDSLIEKIRLIIRLLPPWVKPEGYRDVLLHLQNLDTGGAVVGESANAEFGRGGRASMTLLDEAGAVHSPLLASIWDATESSAKFRVLVYNAPPSLTHFVMQQEKVLPPSMVRLMDWRSDPTRSTKVVRELGPEDDELQALEWPLSKLAPAWGGTGVMTLAQFKRAYCGDASAGRIGIILEVSEVNLYADDSATFDQSWRHCPRSKLIASWDWGTGFRKQTTELFLVRVVNGKTMLFLDRCYVWGEVPFTSTPDMGEDSQLDILYRDCRRDYGRPPDFHTGDSAGRARESDQRSRIDKLRSYSPPGNDERPFTWWEQEAIDDPFGDEKEKLFVNTEPWKEFVVEEMVQPALTERRLLIHSERAGEVYEDAQVWGWEGVEGKTQYEAEQKSKARHKMSKAAPSDRCEPVLYGVFAIERYMQRLRAPDPAPVRREPSFEDVGHGIGGIRPIV